MVNFYVPSCYGTFVCPRHLRISWGRGRRWPGLDVAGWRVQSRSGSDFSLTDGGLKSSLSSVWHISDALLGKGVLFLNHPILITRGLLFNITTAPTIFWHLSPACFVILAAGYHLQLRSRPWNFLIGRFVLQSSLILLYLTLQASSLPGLSSNLVIVRWLASLCLDKDLLPRSVALLPVERRGIFERGNLEGMSMSSKGRHVYLHDARTIHSDTCLC